MQKLYRDLIPIWAAVIFAVAAVLHISGACLAEDFNSGMGKQSQRILLQVVNEIKKNYVESIPDNQIIERAIDGIAGVDDPYTVLLPPDRFKILEEKAKGGFGGVGLYLAKQENLIVVAGVVKGGPADFAGIKVKDRIIKINNETVSDLTQEEIGLLLKGSPGSIVNLIYIPEKASGPVEIRLTRRIIEVSQARFGMADPSGLGYMLIYQFSGNTLEQVINGLEELEASDTGLKGLIIDLRNNPGGKIEQAISVADLFIENGPIVFIKGRTENDTKVVNAHPVEIKRSYPIVVLVNSNSASAAEILAGALKDHKRAVVAGEPSFGKGSIQKVVALTDGYGLKYTIAKYYTPSGRRIDGKGIIPDVPIRMDDGENDGYVVSQALKILKGLLD